MPPIPIYQYPIFIFMVAQLITRYHKILKKLFFESILILIGTNFWTCCKAVATHASTVTQKIKGPAKQKTFGCALDRITPTQSRPHTSKLNRIIANELYIHIFHDISTSIQSGSDEINRLWKTGHMSKQVESSLDKGSCAGVIHPGHQGIGIQPKEAWMMTDLFKTRSIACISLVSMSFVFISSFSAMFFDALCIVYMMWSNKTYLETPARNT